MYVYKFIVCGILSEFENVEVDIIYLFQDISYKVNIWFFYRKIVILVQYWIFDSVRFLLKIYEKVFQILLIFLCFFNVIYVRRIDYKISVNMVLFYWLQNMVCLVFCNVILVLYVVIDELDKIWFELFQ